MVLTNLHKAFFDVVEADERVIRYEFELNNEGGLWLGRYPKGEGGTEQHELFLVPASQRNLFLDGLLTFIAENTDA